MNKKTETWLIVADIHYEYVNKKALKLVKQIGIDLCPDVLCSLGDECDYEGISKYTMKDFGEGVKTCKKELESFKEEWENLVSACGKPKQVMCLGNHNSERVNKLLFKLRSKKMDWEYEQVKKELDFKENFIGVKMVEYNEFIKKNDLILTHGEYHNSNHAKTHALRYETNVLYGHMHTYSAHTEALKGNGKKRTAVSMPCLCQLNPRYRNNISSSWVNGCAVVTFYDNTHQLEIVEFKNNKCMFRGKEYAVK